MENKNRLVSEEEIKQERRKKQLAIIKASNEMLVQARETVMNTDKLDDVTRTERINDINKAIEENYIKAERSINATKKEVDESVYGEVSEEEKKKYAERLKRLGRTEEDVERKDIAMIAVQTEEKKSKRKHVLKKKLKDEETERDIKNEIIERLPHEEELMKKSMATEERIRIKMGVNTRQEDKFEKEIKDTLENQKIKVVKKDKEHGTEIKNETENNESTIEEIKDLNSNNDGSIKGITYSFDFSQIPDYVQYDMIPLPSNGKCYPIDSPLRCGRIPVAYLTASDENIIASPNMYRDGKIIDVILERKILDKRINIQDLVIGDRDAIVLWLRATGYGPQFPIITTNPYNNKKYDVTVDLNQLKYKDFNLDSDNDGNFEFVTDNGDVFKFNFITQKMDEQFRRDIINNKINIEKADIIKYANNIKDCLNNIDDISLEDSDDILGCITDINDIINDTIDDNVDEEAFFINTITEQMILHTKSINGITDEGYVRNYIENMRSYNALKYRTFINNNVPGVDFELTIDIPESDGGGSFTTFLKFGNDVFINI